MPGRELNSLWQLDPLHFLQEVDDPFRLAVQALHAVLVASDVLLVLLVDDFGLADRAREEVPHRVKEGRGVEGRVGRFAERACVPLRVKFLCADEWCSR